MRGQPGTGHRTALAALATALVLLASTTPAGAAPQASPSAPKPTSAGRSPSTPNPHPPAGGWSPDGTVPGGAHLASRGLVTPAGAPKLPTGLRAHGWILVDLDSGAVLAARDPHGRYQPASILKVLTALSIAGQLPGRRVVTVSPAAAAAEGSAIGLLPGGRYSVDQLFAALFLISANDAALALSEASGGVARTVAEMNAEAARLGAYDTVVQTPSGLDGWQQLTSAYDMALVLRAFVNQPRLVRYDRLPSAGFPPRASRYGHVGTYQFDNQSTNFLSTVPGALVAKSGYTDAARHTYLAAASRHGRRLGVVLLRDERQPVDEYRQVAALLDWGYALKPGVQPVGMLTGPGSAGQPVVAAVPAGKAGAPPAAQALARQASGGLHWSLEELLPISALIAGGLWLANAIAGRRRAIRPPARRRR
ncbi:MAG: serine hydrolase [Actinobacteria bacterium]|nr:serine hydrolase [Actinomycetota bacterium]